MKLLEDLKNYVGSWQLSREIGQKRLRRKLLPFHQVNQIGILYNAESKENEQQVTAYANQLRAEGKKVFLLGYVDQKNLPPTKKFLFQSEFYWKEKLNGINLPIKGKIGQFLSLEFDLLLNLYFEPLLPLKAVSAYSNAKYRVGSFIPDGLKYYDFMLDVGATNNLLQLIEEMDFYLRNIK